MGQNMSNIHCSVDETMNMFDYYLTKTYSTISGGALGQPDASAITEGALPNFFKNTLGSQMGREHYLISCHLAC